MADRITDIAVIGSGPAGATVARLLAKLGRDILMIDQVRSEGDRLEIISPTTMGFVGALDLDDLVNDPRAARPCVGIRRIWASDRTEHDHFISRPGGLGYVVDRMKFDAHLRVLAQRAGVLSLSGHLTSVKRAGAVFELKVGRGCAPVIVRTSQLIDASGRSAVAARRLGGKCLVSERLVAERQCLVRSDRPSQQAIWLDIVADAREWTYGTSGPDGRREVWSIRRGGARHASHGDRLNASAALLSPAAGKNWIAVGDAASAFDPIAAQGLGHALASAMKAAEIIVREGEVTESAAANYSAVIKATFDYSERGRREVYRAMRSSAHFEMACADAKTR